MKTRTPVPGLIALASLSSLAPAFAGGPGTPVVDEALFQSIRQSYDGTWKGNFAGSIGTELEDDGAILVDYKDRLAEFTFYNLPKAKEDIRYVPSTANSGWDNYFDRQGPSIACGMFSYDLKKTRFPGFKCRFTVDEKGNVTSFTDRSYSTESRKTDFHYREVHGKSGPATALSDYQITNSIDYPASERAVAIRIEGPAAEVLYAKLSMAEKIVPIGMGAKASEKYGAQIRCGTVYPEHSNTYCETVVDWNGLAHAPKGAW